MDYYPPRIYDLNLQTVALVVGLFLLAIHLLALLRPEQTQTLLTRLPRSKSFGIAVLAIDAVWCFWLASNMDLGEFSGFRHLLQICIPVLAVLTILYVDEFLSARALGILALLVAEPILSSAFLRPEIARLLLVILAYVSLTVGMFWIGKPYLLRDQISWLTRSATRWRFAAIAGVTYGAVVLLCALTIF